jgi:hypothetical protein
LNDFKYSLGTRYQLILANLSSYINESNDSYTTAASTQYYKYKPGTVSLDNITITIGSMTFTLTPIYDQAIWNQLNALTIQPSAIPQFYFPRKDDFGIWPIPQDAYTMTPYQFSRDRNMTVDDETTGTVALTLDDETVTLSGGTFSEAMVGRWFTVTDTTKPGQGYWYRVATYTDTTHIELDRKWNAATLSGATYRIGESPEIPEEAHILLPDGTAADFYSGLRNDQTQATWFNNKFWTGDGNNNSRDIGSENVRAGLIGLINNYQNRDKSNLVYRNPVPVSPYFKVWASSIT